MRKAMLIWALLGLACSLWAESPEAGTWKLNLAKSMLPPSTQAPLKEETGVFREIGEQWEVTFAGMRTDGSSYSIKDIVSRQGGIIRRQPLPKEGESWILTVIEPGHWYLSLLRDGNQVKLLDQVINKNHKTMHVTERGINAQGKSYEATYVYEKQEEDGH